MNRLLRDNVAQIVLLEAVSRSSVRTPRQASQVLVFAPCSCDMRFTFRPMHSLSWRDSHWDRCLVRSASPIRMCIQTIAIQM